MKTMLVSQNKFLMCMCETITFTLGYWRLRALVLEDPFNNVGVVSDLTPIWNMEPTWPVGNNLIPEFRPLMHGDASNEQIIFRAICRGHDLSESC